MIKQDNNNNTNALFPSSFSNTMTIEEPEPNPTSDHILDWIEGSLSYLPSFFDDPYSSGDPYNSGDINDDSWLVISQDLDQQLVNNSFTSTNNNSASTTTTATSTPLTDPIISTHPSPSQTSKKRKATDEPNKASQIHRKNQSRQIEEAGGGDQAVVEQGVPVKKGGNKRGASKSAGNNCNNGNNKEGRWAEQLLNPCASAITAGNLTRVQHLLYVLHELASPTGDANHRLAAHGLRALTHHLSSASHSYSVSGGVISFPSAKPKFFQQSLINFNDINPWFTFPNNIANSSILQILSQQHSSHNLHIVDIGVSHGVQWPTLLEALTRRTGGPPPLVRLTVVAPAVETSDTPFAVGPPGYNFASQLVAYAKTININLHINRIESRSLQSLNAQVLGSSPEETLIVCAQFRIHQLNHNNPDNRTEFMKVLRSLEPKGVILSENNMDCSCNNCGNFATGFARRVEYLWRFLDSTSAAFKGRESEERRMLEGEAAKALTNLGEGEMNDRKDKWCERMRSVGFVGEVFGEEVIDGARALLKKYDSNWEMRVDECVGLWWKGQPVSFCSLWKTDG